MRRRRRLIRGPVLLGFAQAFDRASGREDTPRPYPVITPSRVGGVLLPFQCPHCGAVCSETVDPKRRKGYTDKERGFSWCPRCRRRYIVNLEGMPLAEALPAGATFAPARVERGDKVETLDGPREDGLDLLGAA